MTNERTNQDGDEITQNREWQTLAMIGEWKGTGRWNENKQWKGHGTWQGGLLSGIWNGNGEWEHIGNGKGKWAGHGNLISNMSFRRYAAKISLIMEGLVVIAAIILIAAVAKGLISSGFVVGGGIAAILLLFVASRQETAKGEWSGEGTWEDDGEFRILDMRAKWKLGHHTGTLRGKMKDIKPR